MENETVWLSTSQMAELFGRNRTVITRHINNCFKEGELDRNITCAKFAQVQQSNDVYFLHVNREKGILYGESGRTRTADNTLVALKLMIAESRTEEKDVMVKVVVNLINKENF